jgi:arylsulfatase A-like enzyme
MSKRSPLLFLILALWAPNAASQGIEALRPNILFILADDLGWGDPSCYGNLRFYTPNIDRLAREGTLFKQFYQGGSVCSPSRCSLLTGRWPAEFRIHGHYADAHENRKRGMSQYLDPLVATLPKLLQQSGYATAHVGKWHLGLGPQSAAGLAAYGFEEAHWVDVRSKRGDRTIDLWDAKERPRASRMLVDSTIEALRRLKDKPFYCQLWLNDPHTPLAPSKKQMEPFAQKEPKGFNSPFAVYAGTVTEMDRQIGRLLDELDKLGLTENTIVIFSSDNGPEDIAVRPAARSGMGSAGPLRGRKRSLYEGGVRVPFLVRWPKVTPAADVNDTTVISGADLLPTLCELTGTAVPPDVQATLRGDKGFSRSQPLVWEWRFEIFAHVWNHSPMLAVRDGQWKLLLNPDRSRVELYNIPTDPSERNNVAAQHPDVVA